MARIPFNVSAKTARLIGRENVSNLEGALIELIKNTYDADAKKCVVYYESSTDDFGNKLAAYRRFLINTPM